MKALEKGILQNVNEKERKIREHQKEYYEKNKDKIKMDRVKTLIGKGIK